MSSDIERIRDLALKESARLTEEKNREEDRLASEARRLAKAHLPLWSAAIEKAIQKGKSPKYFSYLRFERAPFLRSMGFRDSIQWGEFAKGHPSINVAEIPDSAIDIYTEELTLLLGKPFEVTHTRANSVQGHYSDGQYIEGYSTDNSFHVSWK